ANTREALTRDLGSFTKEEVESAFKKLPFVKAFDELGGLYLQKRAKLGDLIKSVNGNSELTTDPFPENDLPKTRRVLGWFDAWISSGRDVRALVDFHSKKGNRTDRLEGWERDEINRAIDKFYNAEIRGSEAVAWQEAHDSILIRWKTEGLV